VVKKVFVDNETQELREVLKQKLKTSDSVDIAVGYFFLSGFNEIKDVIPRRHNFMRIVMGDEIDEYTYNEIVSAMYNKIFEVVDSMDNYTLDKLSDFITKSVVSIRVYNKKKLHSKVYLFNEGEKGSYIVGSSNLTKSGLVSNLELNIYDDDYEVYKELKEWYEKLWNESNDFNESIIKIIELKKKSKNITLGKYLPPRELFKYILWNYFNGELPKIDQEEVLTVFQLIGYINALEKIQKYNGVILADSVGLGKTFIALKLIYNFVTGKILLGFENKVERNVMIITPAQILFQWRDLLLSEYFFGKKEFRIEEKKRGRLHVIEVYRGMEKMGEIALVSHQGFAIYKDNELRGLNDEYSLFVIDEAHRFRNYYTKRHKNALKMKYKSDGTPNKFFLITATPIVNSIWDLYSLLELFQDFTLTKIKMNTEGVEKKYVMDIRELFKQYSILKKQIYNQIGDIKELRRIEQIIREYIINEFIILRTRKYIMENFKDVTINGKPIRIQDPEVIPLRYSDTNFYNYYFKSIKQIMNIILKVKFTYARLFTKGIILLSIGPEGDEEKISVSIDSVLKLLLFKRLESSIYSFKKTVERMIDKMQKAYEFIYKYGDQLEEYSHKLLTLSEDIQNEILSDSDLYDIIGENTTSRRSDVMKIFLSNIAEKGKDQILSEIKLDIQLMNKILDTIEKIEKSEYEFKVDPKLEKLKSLLIEELKDKKILIFSQYKDTVNYLYKNIKKFLDENNINRNVDFITGELDNKEKERKIKRFAPESNNAYDEADLYGEIDILISTDSISEGVNLQDADAVINYDLPYNPMIIVQRVGRVSRIGNMKKVKVYNFIVPEEIDEMIHLMEKLEEKIDTIAKLLSKEFYIISPDEEISIRTFGEKIKDLSQKTLSQIEEMSINELLLNTKDEKVIDDTKLISAIIDKYKLSDNDFETIKNLDPNTTYYSIIGQGELYVYYEVYINDNLFDRKLVKVINNNLKNVLISEIEKLYNSNAASLTNREFTSIVNKLQSLDFNIDYIKEILSLRHKKTGIIQQLISIIKDIIKTKRLIEDKEIDKEKAKNVLNMLVINEFSQRDRREIKQQIHNYIIERGGRIIVKPGNEKDLINKLYEYLNKKKLTKQNEIKIKVKAWYY